MDTKQIQKIIKNGEWPNDHDWFCECEVCEPLWEAITKDVSLPMPNYSDELEAELDLLNELDGWSQ